jgi:hypothetical protein
MKLFPKLSANARMCLIGVFVFGLFGVFMFPWMIWSRGRLEDMLKWPTAEAQIIAADTKWVHRRNEGTRYQHKLTYRFVVSNQSYVGDRAAYGGTPPEWRSEAEARGALPALGSKVRIRYNPREPSDTVIHVIRTSDSDENLLRWVVAGVGLAGGGLMVVGGIPWRREKR